jgi:VRR-NUC domain
MRFKRWTGEPLANSYGNKSAIDCDGEAVFAELAVLRGLQKEGYQGVWVDTYSRCFRNRMYEKCDLPAQAREYFDKIVKANGGKCSGCWDVFAWKANDYVFVEVKRKSKPYRDRIQKTQLRWADAVLRSGVDVPSFRICEWDIEESM